MPNHCICSCVYKSIHQSGIACSITGTDPDKLTDFDNADYMELHFYEENAHRINEIIKAYSGERGAKPENATNGLYYRGVL